VQLLDAVLPRRCVVCESVGDDLCRGCRLGLTLLRGPACERCGAPASWPVARCRECSGRRLGFVRARSAVAYDDSARKVVAAWKERGLRMLAAQAAELVAAAVRRPPVYTLTFVPADPDRRLRRGYNPAERLARELGHLWHLPTACLLERAAGVRPQRGLPLAERRRNVRDAFRAIERAPAALVLVDDVYTSGATASAAATALRMAGARHVEVVTFARAVRG
jgi:predicted amidophosphoribosyltransferase